MKRISALLAVFFLAFFVTFSSFAFPFTTPHAVFDEDGESLVGFEISSLPKKLEYNVGDSIDLTGFSATLFTENGYVTEKLTGKGTSFAKNTYLDYYRITPTVSPVKFTQAGEIKVVITVGNVEEGFTVKVNGGTSGGEDSDKLVGIDIISKPNKTEYNVGDSIDLTGLSALLVTENGYASEKLTGKGTSFAKNTYLDYYKMTPTVSPSKFTQAGEIKVVITVGDAQDSFTVTVNGDEEHIVSLEVVSYPKKVEYERGEEFDLDGLEIRMYTENGYVNEKLIGSGNGFEKNTFLTETGRKVNVVCTEHPESGEVFVSVDVDGISCAFKITFIEKTEESKEESSEISEEESEESNGEKSESSEESEIDDTSEVSEPDRDNSDEETDEPKGENEKSSEESKENKAEESQSGGNSSEVITKKKNKTKDYVVIGGACAGCAALAAAITAVSFKRKKK